MTVHVLSMRDKAPEGAFVVDTTTRSKNWSRGLSPMLLGPAVLGFTLAQNVENLWQYSKVYPQHWDVQLKLPTKDWWAWSKYGFGKRWADRYPMGKGATPVCSWHGSTALDYVSARKWIYFPAYRSAVVKSAAFQMLIDSYEQEGEIWLRDYDGYDHRALGMSLDDVINDPTRKMGHAFVLARLLEAV